MLLHYCFDAAVLGNCVAAVSALQLLLQHVLLLGLCMLCLDHILLRQLLLLLKVMPQVCQLLLQFICLLLQLRVTYLHAADSHTAHSF